MNVLTIFEQRITAIFLEGAPGSRAPFSFKRLAKRAVREMEDETFVIDGVDTAPALYTILVSARDDDFMRHMYIDITEEISQLVEAQAKKRGYTFVGKPLVRFMVDPALRGGRFSVFAENIDPRTLARLRDEENAYLGITPPREIEPEQEYVPEYVPADTSEPAYVSEEASFVPEPIFEDEPIFSSEPAPIEDVPEISAEFQQIDYQDQVVAPEESEMLAEEVLDDVEMEEPAGGNVFWGQGSSNAAEPELEAVSAPEPEPSFEPTPAAEPAEEAAGESAEHKPFFVPAQAAPAAAAAAAPEPAPAPEPEPAPKPTCQLIDLGSGATYTITSTRSIIGRERTTGGVVLRDPNVSRRHAELSYTATGWRIFDLGSTNGTLVNDVDVREANLRNGDILTIGLVNLEFRAG